MYRSNKRITIVNDLATNTGIITIKGMRLYRSVVNFLQQKHKQTTFFYNGREFTRYPLLKKELVDIENKSRIVAKRIRNNIPLYSLGTVATRCFCFHYDVASHYEGIEYFIRIVK